MPLSGSAQGWHLGVTSGVGPRMWATRGADALPIQPHRFANDALGVDRSAQVLYVDGLVFENLVVQEESLELPETMRGQLRDVPVVLVLGIVDVDRDDLVVLPLLVPHRQHPDRLRAQDAERQHGLLTQHQHVKGVAVVAEGLRQEAIVGGVVNGAGQDAVEREQAGRLVQLVLDLRAFGDLDHRAEMPLDLVAELDVVPRVHHAEYSPRPTTAPWALWPTASACRIIATAMATDDFESWFERGVTDGLPVVPPTRERVERMLEGTRRDRAELVGEMPPNHGRVTVEKAAI